MGNGDDIITELARVTINGIAQTCFSGRTKGKMVKLPFNRKTFSVGFQLRTEPDLSDRDSHSTSTLSIEVQVL